MACKVKKTQKMMTKPQPKNNFIYVEALKCSVKINHRKRIAVRYETGKYKGLIVSVKILDLITNKLNIDYKIESNPGLVYNIKSVETKIKQTVRALLTMAFKEADFEHRTINTKKSNS
jgi:hypothetical protein